MPAPLLSELIRLRPFSPVISSSDVRECRRAWHTGDESLAAEFVAGYLGHDERSRHALDAAMRALLGRNAGAAFFVNGVFGSGKSHLLGVLALLCEGAGIEAFAGAHPALAVLPREFSRRLVVHFSLDDYAADVWSLEAAFWREVRDEWERATGDELALESENLPRGEVFTLLEEALQGAGFAGLCLFADEVSLFLSGRDAAGIQRDAAFLQFIGERSRRAPLWVFAAIQKSVEHIGALPEYSLAQIRDRYQTLPLGLAHIPSLIEHRLIERRDHARLESLCRETFDELARALPELDFGLDEWRRFYPFTPGTLALLEGIAGRFLSRTRSAASFCVRETERLLQAEAPATSRVGTDALWEYARPEFERHADLKALDGAWETWCDLLPELAPNPEARPLLERLMRGLLLFKAAGRALTVTALCHATSFESGLPGEANYLYARGLLEALRTRGPFVAVERGEAPLHDRYAVDLGTRAGEMARRMVANLRRDLPGDDPRTRDFVRHCAVARGLPLGNDGTLEAFWRHAPRRIALAVWDGHASISALANRAGALREPGTPEDALLVICPPLGDREAARRAWDEACRQAADELSRAALLLWLPRPPATDEVELAREATAAHLLESDPALSDNRRGRAILSHLREGAPSRDAQIGQLAARLLREGELFTGAGAYADAGEVLVGEQPQEWLEAIASFALPAAFPLWESVAPRARVMTGSVCDALCLEILRRPSDAPFFAPSHERAVRAVCEPLGLAGAAEGRWRIQVGRDELREAGRRFLGEGATFAALEAYLAKSEWGLAREQVALVVCGMLRGGELLALDARNIPLLPHSIGMPLARGVRSLRHGTLLDADEWDKVRRIMENLNLSALPPLPTFEMQESAHVALLRWREELAGETELAAARLSQIKRALNTGIARAEGDVSDDHSWQAADEARANIEAGLRAMSEPLPAADALRRAGALFDPPFHDALLKWREISEGLEARHAILLRAGVLLRHPDLVVPPELAPARDALVLRLTAGEAMLHDPTFAGDFAAWQHDYEDAYRAWHGAQHDAARFLSFRRLASGDAMRALERLEILAARSFSAGAETREALRDEVGKACAREGSLRPEAPVCDACRLRWGERLRLRDPREIEASMSEGFAALRRALGEEPVVALLGLADAGRALLEWRDQPAASLAEAGRTLLPLIDEGGLGLLERAFTPHRLVARDLNELNAVLRECRTRAECGRAFQRWLDSDGLGPDDEIVWE